jgi:hypothetical protein
MSSKKYPISQKSTTTKIYGEDLQSLTQFGQHYNPYHLHILFLLTCYITYIKTECQNYFTYFSLLETGHLYILDKINKNLTHHAKSILSSWHLRFNRPYLVYTMKTMKTTIPARNMVHTNIILCEHVKIFILWHNYLNTVQQAITRQWPTQQRKNCWK